MDIPSVPIEVKKQPKKPGGRARETLYRVTMQNQMQSISIADQKANIIIGINTILISIIMSCTPSPKLNHRVNSKPSI